MLRKNLGWGISWLVVLEIFFKYSQRLCIISFYYFFLTQTSFDEDPIPILVELVWTEKSKIKWTEDYFISNLSEKNNKKKSKRFVALFASRTIN